jgi:hypothetical protein
MAASRTDAHGELPDAGQRRKRAEILDRRTGRRGEQPDTRSTSAPASATVFPVTRSVINDAEAFAMAHPWP